MYIKIGFGTKVIVNDKQYIVKNFGSDRPLNSFMQERPNIEVESSDGEIIKISFPETRALHDGDRIEQLIRFLTNG